MKHQKKQSKPLMQMGKYYIILLILVGLSCGKNASQKEQKTLDPNTPKTTLEKKASELKEGPRVYCNINGHQWQGGAVSGSLIKENELGIVIVDISGVAPIKNKVDFTTMFNLSMRNFKGVGTYDKDISFSIKNLYRDNPEMSEDQTNIGKIKVTKWDAETKTISGEFKTIIPAKSNDKHNVEEGYFSNIVLKEVNIH